MLNLPAGHWKPMKISAYWTAIIIDRTDMLHKKIEMFFLLNWVISHAMEYELSHTISCFQWPENHIHLKLYACFAAPI